MGRKRIFRREVERLLFHSLPAPIFIDDRIFYGQRRFCSAATNSSRNRANINFYSRGSMKDCSPVQVCFHFKKWYLRYRLYPAKENLIECLLGKCVFFASFNGVAQTWALAHRCTFSFCHWLLRKAAPSIKPNCPHWSDRGIRNCVSLNWTVSIGS